MPPHSKQQAIALTLDRMTWRNELAMALTEASGAVRAADNEVGLKEAADIVLTIADEIRASIGRTSISDVSVTLRRAAERLAKIRTNHG